VTTGSHPDARSGWADVTGGLLEQDKVGSRGAGGPPESRDNERSAAPDLTGERVTMYALGVDLSWPI
jgi:hypothetical protein